MDSLCAAHSVTESVALEDMLLSSLLRTSCSVTEAFWNKYQDILAGKKNVATFETSESVCQLAQKVAILRVKLANKIRLQWKLNTTLKAVTTSFVKQCQK